MTTADNDPRQLLAQSLLATARHPLLIIDPDLNVISVNPAFASTFALSPQALRGHSLFGVLGGAFDTPALRAQLDDLITRGVPFDAFELERNFGSVGRKLLLISGRLSEPLKPAMVVLSVEDHTERQTVLTQLREQRALLAAILESAAQGILAVDRNGVIRLANPMAATLFGYDPEELPGTGLSELIPVRLRARHVAHVVDYFRSPRVRPVDTSLELIGLRKDGTEFPIEIGLSQIETEQGPLAVSFLSDISARRAYENALIDAQRELRQLTARLTVAQEQAAKHIARELHDVFSQKLALLGMRLSEIEQLSAAIPEVAERARFVNQDLGVLARDLHQISRQLHPAILDDLGLAVALESECRQFSAQFGIPAHFFGTEVPAEVPDAVALGLYRIAQEALRNVRHTTATAVNVRLAGNGDALSLRIEDLGGGFDLAAARQRGGIGLASMRERAAQIGGELTIESDIGRGTVVQARVPVAQRAS